MISNNLFSRAERELQSMRLLEALDLFEKAELHGYDADLCSSKRWTCYMLLGEFESAWQESDRISARGRPDPNRFWDGTPFDSRHVLIRCLHGLGDTFQFIRYTRLLRKRVRSLTIEAQPSLKTLLSQARLADQVITWREPEPSWDQQIEVIELPRAFRTTLDSIPDHVPYLMIPREEPFIPYDGSRPLRIALVWGCGTHNLSRSMRLRDLAVLFALPGVLFFSFQSDPERSQLQPWAAEVCDAYTGSAGTLLTAQQINSVDLVITVDTMMAHLAGAMGCPVWTLLPFACDWRWMAARTDSPWYPTMRLFRQPKPGDWPTVIQSVRQKLQDVLRGGSLVFPASEAPVEYYAGSCGGRGKVK